MVASKGKLNLVRSEKGSKKESTVGLYSRGRGHATMILKTQMGRIHSLIKLE